MLGRLVGRLFLIILCYTIVCFLVSLIRWCLDGA